MPLLALLALTAAGARHVTVEPLADGRFRVSTTFAAAAPPELQARRMIQLREAAEQECRGRAAPVSQGTLEANHAAGRRDLIVLSEIYSCGPMAASTSTSS
ncbi:MAG TPA: hypothetical protein VEW04_04375 [Allosphingosinicella sp.]|nr:hypothetical protein [Allosphingosinicella sp.]